MHTMETALQVLKDNGYKMTNQRKLIIKTVAKEENRDACCKYIYAQVKREDPSVGLATVYRTMNMLGELGIFQRAGGPNRLRENRIVCPECGRTEMMPPALTQKLAGVLAGFGQADSCCWITVATCCAQCAESRGCCLTEA